MQTPSLMWYRMVYLQIYLQFIRPKLFKKVDKNQSIDRSIIYVLEWKTAI